MAASENHHHLLLASILFFLFLSPVARCSPTKLGVVYRDLPTNPEPERVIPKLPASNIRHVHLPNPTPKTMEAFQHTDIELLVSIPNDLIPRLAGSVDVARSWVAEHILPFYPQSKVTLLSVGIGVDTISPDLVHAVKNVRVACVNAGAKGLSNIRVTTSLSFSVLNNPLPPSAATFRDSGSVVGDLLKQLDSTGSPVLFELYPYELLEKKPSVPLKMALFEDGVYRDDPGSNLRYYNAFDEMIDAIVVAKKKVGHARTKVSVSGTGWPTEGWSDANVENAGKYDKGLLDHLRSGQGSPQNREGPGEVYINELFDNIKAPLPKWNRHYGIWYASSLTSKFDDQPEDKKKKKSGAEGLPSGFGLAVGLGVAALLLLV